MERLSSVPYTATRKEREKIKRDEAVKKKKKKQSGYSLPTRIIDTRGLALELTQKKEEVNK